MNEKVKEILEWAYCIIIALVLALLFRYFIATPTIVKQRSMFPTLKDGERLILNRTFRITDKKPEIGDIVTFEAPIEEYKKWKAGAQTAYETMQNTNTKRTTFYKVVNELENNL